jgi:hypothetical protein
MSRTIRVLLTDIRVLCRVLNQESLLEFPSVAVGVVLSPPICTETRWNNS